MQIPNHSAGYRINVELLIFRETMGAGAVYAGEIGGECHYNDRRAKVKLQGLPLWFSFWGHFNRGTHMRTLVRKCWWHASVSCILQNEGENGKIRSNMEWKRLCKRAYFDAINTKYGGEN